ncbi:unnamed protein product [Rhodiola kirilowii]
MARRNQGRVRRDQAASGKRQAASAESRSHPGRSRTRPRKDRQPSGRPTSMRPCVRAAIRPPIPAIRAGMRAPARPADRASEHSQPAPPLGHPSSIRAPAGHALEHPTFHPSGQPSLISSIRTSKVQQPAQFTCDARVADCSRRSKVA